MLVLPAPPGPCASGHSQVPVPAHPQHCFCAPFPPSARCHTDLARGTLETVPLMELQLHSPSDFKSNLGSFSSAENYKKKSAESWEKHTQFPQ